MRRDNHHSGEPLWLSISAYARLYSIDRVTVYKWLKAGRLQFYQVGQLTKIRNLPPDRHPRDEASELGD